MITDGEGREEVMHSRNCALQSKLGDDDGWFEGGREREFQNRVSTGLSPRGTLPKRGSMLHGEGCCLQLFWKESRLAVGQK